MIPISEDCLYLNVWTGAKKAGEKQPVLVWYFGGGFQWGYTAEMEFDGVAVGGQLVGVQAEVIAQRLANRRPLGLLPK
jgi:carboxylesterase type B